MNKIQHAGKFIELPEKWNDLSLQQLKHIAKNWNLWALSVAVSAPAFVSFRIRMLFVLCSVSRWNVFSFRHRFLMSIIPGRRQLKKMNEEEFVNQYSHLPLLVELTDFIFKMPCDLTKNKLPVIKTNLGELHGPGDELATLVFQEFIFADSYFTQYATSKQDEHLDWLVAMLYRPRKKVIDRFSDQYLGDERSAFNLAATETMLPAVRSMKQWQKLCVFFFYMGCRNQLEKDYPNVFSSANGSEDDSAVSNWYNTMSDLPAEKFGTIRQREQYPLKTVLQELEKLIVEHSNLRQNES